MPQTFNFSECYRLLDTNPKTFKGWLEKAHIDSNKQVNAADPRQKYLTLKQVQMLAELHGRILPPLDKEETAAPTITIESLVEQIATNHTLLTEQIAVNNSLLTEMTHSFNHILSLLQEQVNHQQQFGQINQRIEHLATLVQERIAPQKDSSSHQQEQEAFPYVEQAFMEPTSDVAPTALIRSEELTTPTTPPKPTSAATKGKHKSTTSRSTNKAKSKGKSLPRTLVPLRVFADQHQIEMKVAERASERGKITVVRGKWLYDSRIVAKALNVGGQRSFYEYFSTQEGFTRCKQCPHGAQEDSEGISLAG